MKFITSSSDLHQVCDSLLTSHPVICVDTEFIREKTYFPILSLIQIATSEEVFLIDALKGCDLSPLKDFFQRFQGKVVMFSARQDLETFHHRLGFLPAKVFDVQIALEALGHPPSMGYATAVKTYLGVTLDKTNQYSNWLQRPLTEQQAQYAANDVIYLGKLFAEVEKRICSPFKKEWLLEDMAFLTNPDTYEIDPAFSWKRCRLQSKNKRYLLRLKHLAAFREEIALSKDVPRSHVMADSILHEMALKGHIINAVPEVYCPTLEALLKEVAAMDISQAPFIKPMPTPLSPDTILLGAFVIEWLVRVYGFSSSYLASTAERDSLLRQQPEGRLKAGWRYEVLSRPLLACLQGKQGITLHHHSLGWLHS